MLPRRVTSRWSTSSLFNQISTAKDWGLIPSQFFALDKADKVLMMAHTKATGDMQAYEDYRNEQRRRRNSKDGGKAKGLDDG